jgi:hypothetical protein
MSVDAHRYLFRSERITTAIKRPPFVIPNHSIDRPFLVTGGSLHLLRAAELLGQTTVTPFGAADIEWAFRNFGELRCIITGVTIRLAIAIGNADLFSKSYVSREIHAYAISKLTLLSQSMK